MVKKLLTLFLLATGLASGQFVYTPNVGLELPAGGSTNWNIPLNYNFALLDSLIGATTQNPGVGLSLKPVFGTGAPGIPCTSSNQGQQYFNTATTPFVGYVCNTGTWTLGGASGGGSFPTNAIVYGLTSSTSRAATPSDIAALLGSLTGCSTTNYVYSPANAACVSGASGNTTSTSLTSGTIPLSNGANSIINSLLSDNGTILSYTGSGGIEIPITGGLIFGASGPGLWRLSGGGLEISTGNTAGTGGNLSMGQLSATSVFVSGGNIQSTGNIIAQNALGTNGELDFNGQSGTAGQCAISQGFGNAPAWAICPGGSGGGNTTSTSLTSGVIPLANGANSIINSLLADNGTTLSYSGTGGLYLVSSAPGSGSWLAGSGSINALPASSAGFAAPASGGTSYLIKFPATISGAGIPHLAATATGDGVLESVMTNSLIGIADLSATGTPSSTTFFRGDNTWAAVSGGSSGGVFTHTISGATPTIAVNSSSSPAIDVNNFLLSANVTSITLPASSAVADGEKIYLNVQQSASGGPYTLPTGSVITPLTAGSGTTIVNAVPGGCPTIGAVQSSTAPSELFMVLQYHSALTEYEILGCQTSVYQTGVVESFLPSTGLWGGSPVNTVVVGGTPTNSGKILKLQVLNQSGGTCTTPPAFNVFDGTSNIGTAVTANTSQQTKGNATNQNESVSYNAGDNIGAYVSSAGSGCSSVAFSVTVTVGEP